MTNLPAKSLLSSARLTFDHGYWQRLRPRRACPRSRRASSLAIAVAPHEGVLQFRDRPHHGSRESTFRVTRVAQRQLTSSRCPSSRSSLRRTASGRRPSPARSAYKLTTHLLLVPESCTDLTHCTRAHFRLASQSQLSVRPNTHNRVSAATGGSRASFARASILMFARDRSVRRAPQYPSAVRSRDLACRATYKHAHDCERDQRKCQQRQRPTARVWTR